MIATLLLAAAPAMTFTADRIAADAQTRAVVATGHVHAVSSPYTLRGESLSHAADGTFFFRDPTYATTCTNELGHTHWNVTGEIQYRAEDYVILRNMRLTFCEVPIMWLPYMYYPLGTDCGFSWMPGYTGRWGAYLLTRTSYDLYGSPTNGTAWIRGGTRFDLRYEQGIAAGQDFKWSFERLGRGQLQFYHAWDRSDLADQYNIPKAYCDMDRNRYGLSATHRLDLTERDNVWARGSYYSDCYFRQEFLRKTLLDNKRRFLAYDNSGVFWDHVENDYAFGAEVSGRLNEFYDMVGRLPEAYFDINPQPLFGWPVNFESENHVGYLKRGYADYGQLIRNSPYDYSRNRWAAYETARFDTYNRLTAPLKVADDVLSVVPRIGYRGTIWNRSGEANLDGRGKTDDEGNLYRSVLEGGVTFAARGTGWIDERWRHVIEPYFDVLAQEAWLGGGGERPYVFDDIDASVMWEDQFAGRSRNLPYSYYGVTPGLRNAWEKANERGQLRPYFDLDVYSAVQFNDTSYIGSSSAHRLAKAGKPNYGDNGCLAVPGARMRWMPAKDLSVMARAECNTDDATIPVSDVGWQQVITESFRYHVRYVLRDYRIWDYSSVAATRGSLNEERNYAKLNAIELGLTQQPLDWLAWSPFVRWDFRDGKVDSVGTWVDYLTDCLGFRFSVEYESSMTWYGGYERDEDWSFGFYVYLRAFGSGNTGIFD